MTFALRTDRNQLSQNRGPYMVQGTTFPHFVESGLGVGVRSWGWLPTLSRSSSSGGSLGTGRAAAGSQRRQGWCDLWRYLLCNWRQPPTQSTGGWAHTPSRLTWRQSTEGGGHSRPIGQQTFCVVWHGCTPAVRVSNHSSLHSMQKVEWPPAITQVQLVVGCLHQTHGSRNPIQRFCSHAFRSVPGSEHGVVHPFSYRRGGTPKSAQLKGFE